MKSKLLFLAFLALSPLYAFGDFVPGRIRASADAQMAAQRGSGRYEAIKQASLTQFNTDGHGITKFRLLLNGTTPLPFTITENRLTRCGQTFVAIVKANGQSSSLQIDETNPTSCQGEGPVVWRARLTTQEYQANPSTLELSGVPEFYLLTQ